MFNIAAIRFSLRDHALEIYVAGCQGICKGCQNPQLWDPTLGEEWVSFKPEINNTLSEADTLVSSIRIYGGELLEKSKEDIIEFLEYLVTFNLPLWLFTRFELVNIEPELLKYFDYIKCGPYDYTKVGSVTYYGVTLASTNQMIYKKGVNY